MTFQSDIEKKFQLGVCDIFKGYRESLEQVLEHLRTSGDFDIFNGKVSLYNETTIVIKNEQNVDFFIVLEDACTIFYAFEHVYGEEGWKQSLVPQLVGKKNLLEYTPVLTCFIGEEQPKEYSAIYAIRCLNSLEITLNSMFCELDISFPAKKKLYQLDKFVSKPVEKEFKKLRPDVKRLFDSPEVQKIRIKTQQEDEIDEFDALFDELTKSKSPEKTKEEREAECYNNAVVMEKNGVKYVLVNNCILEDDNFEMMYVDIYCCKENDEIFGSFEHLLAHYKDYKNIRVFEYRYDFNKKPKKTSDFSRTRSAVGFFSELTGFLEVLSSANEK